ncbi:hypothetical protein ISF_07269 [Cordyceps fumosorosea ARSEF 2679]|uniref:Uncharacterized protein n=1 Tax=Cordyceps fumosorosea (strain ARSEF 2679) TaxID=1081104 RepID=A0A167PKI2_CORFA|nr:hypothetical protein ISF_07269 [Cordyceps fumosorosea ARSEF 2679]OAA56753.1 hypothetical protein ISF_07269 [Cordyceps fumosorosea ARSEF 2679]
MAASSALEAHSHYIFSGVSLVVTQWAVTLTVWAEGFWRDGNGTMETVDRFMDGLATTTDIQCEGSRTKPLVLGGSSDKWREKPASSSIGGTWHLGLLSWFWKRYFWLASRGQSQEAEEADWKSSFLGLLLPRDGYHVPDDAIEDQARLRKAARAVSVSLAKHDERWSLETTKSVQPQDTE